MNRQHINGATAEPGLGFGPVNTVFDNERSIANQALRQTIQGNMVTNNNYNYIPEQENTSRTTKRVKTLFHVPYNRDKQFIPRQTIFWEIEDRIQESEPVILCGFGGTGKSQIAIEYAYRFREQYPRGTVLWIYAGSSANILKAFEDVAQRLHLTDLQSRQESVCQLVVDWLEQNVNHEIQDQLDSDEEGARTQQQDGPAWLVILDNIDSYELLDQPLGPAAGADETNHSYQTSHTLRDYLPRQLTRANVLLATTRSQDVARSIAEGTDIIPVGPFTPDESNVLIRQRLRATRNVIPQHDYFAVHQLLQMLGHFPLAVSQAASFIIRSRISIPQFLQRLRDNDQQLAAYLSQELQDPRRERGWPNAVFRTWRLSFDLIRKQQPLSAHLLSVAAFLDGQQIPRWLIISATEADGAEIDMAMGTLYSFSLMVEQEEKDSMSVHALVQASVRAWLQQEGLFEKYLNEVVKFVASKFPHGDHQSRSLAKLMYPHATTLLNYCGTENMGDVTLLRLLDCMCQYECDQELNHVAISHVRTTYEASCKLHGEDHEISADYLVVMAAALGNQGQHLKSEEMFRKALDIRRRKTGDDDLNTLRFEACLSRALSLLGRYEEAEEMKRHELDSRYRLQGETHEDTLLAKRYLGQMLCLRSSYDEAERVFREILEVYTNKQRSSDFIMVSVLCDIVPLMVVQQDLQAAKDFSQQAIVLSTKINNPYHPLTLYMRHLLASVLLWEGRNNPMAASRMVLFEFCQRSLPLRNPAQFLSLHDQIYELGYQNRFADSEPLIRQLLGMLQQAPFYEEPAWLVITRLLGITLSEQQKYEEAIEIIRYLISKDTEALGTRSPQTVADMRLLALNLVRAHKYDEAEQTLRRALTWTSMRFERLNNEASLVKLDLTSVLSHKKQYEAAEELCRDVMRGTKELPSDNGQLESAATSALASILGQQQRYDEAESILRAQWDIDCGRWGADHCYTMESSQRIAMCLDMQARYEEAEEQLLRIVEVRLNKCGPTLPCTNRSRWALGKVWDSMGKTDESALLSAQLVPIPTSHMEYLDWLPNSEVESANECDDDGEWVTEDEDEDEDEDGVEWTSNDEAKLANTRSRAYEIG